MATLHAVQDTRSDHRRSSVGGAPWCFRHRSRLIVALVLVLVVGPWQRQPMDTVAAVDGCFFLATGIALRLWCIRQLGGAARKRRRPKAVRLVTWGPFAWMRNPIYIANMVVLAGFTLLAGPAWLLPVLVGAMWVQYCFTVRFEEHFLEERFGAAYRAYAAATPRWIGVPRWRRAPEGQSPYPVGKLIKRERSFLFFQIPSGVLLIVVVRLGSAVVAAGW